MELFRTFLPSASSFDLFYPFEEDRRKAGSFAKPQARSDVSARSHAVQASLPKLCLLALQPCFLLTRIPHPQVPPSVLLQVTGEKVLHLQEAIHPYFPVPDYPRRKWTFSSAIQALPPLWRIRSNCI